MSPYIYINGVRLWMREPFLSRDYDFGKHVVHGHTPVRTGQPDQRPFRTNLDTGALFGGALTAGVFTNDQAHAIAFLQTGPNHSLHPLPQARKWPNSSLAWLQ